MPNAEQLVTPEDILLPTPWCVIREQERGHLLYNPHTDEMHLLPPTGFRAYRLCNGLRTVEEVTTELARSTGAGIEEAGGHVEEYLSGLVVRGLLEVGR